MKTRIILLSLASALVLMSCQDTLSEQLTWDNGVMAALPGYEEMAGTRVNFATGLGSFFWSNGDCIGVCRSSSTSNGTAAFTLLKGGESVGNFINDSFSLLTNADYYAFYPFMAGTTATAFPVNLVTQEQTANNDLSHIGKFNYMSTKFTTDGNGKASFTFSNIGAVIQLHFTAEEEDEYKSLAITSSGAPFTIQATYNMVDGTYTPKSTNGTFRVSFGEQGMHVLKDEDVTVSAVILPDDLSQSTLTFSIRNAAGVVKEMSFAGYAFSKGKLYHFYEVNSKGNPPYGGCPDNHHPHMIDLGMPSGTLWSCMDLGSNVPAECGLGFTWGQAALAEKNYASSWEYYDFMTEGYRDRNGISKYQIPDKNYDGVWYDAEQNFIGDNLTTLEMADDAARQNWGGPWRIPTKAEFNELTNYATCVWDKNYNGIPNNSGYVFYKKKANREYTYWDTHIFMPNGNPGSYTMVPYWTSTLGDQTHLAFAFNFWDASRGRADNRFDIDRIRPVCSK